MAQKSKLARIGGAIKKLIADKEDTKQVFVILEALAGNSGLRAFKRFQKTANAQDILAAEKPLVDYLLDRDWLASLPKGSLGERYYNFTRVEQITADGLTDASIEGRDEERQMSAAQVKYHERMRGFLKPLKGAQARITGQRLKDNEDLFGVFLIGNQFFNRAANAGQFAFLRHNSLQYGKNISRKCAKGQPCGCDKTEFRGLCWCPWADSNRHSREGNGF